MAYEDLDDLSDDLDDDDPEPILAPKAAKPKAKKAAVKTKERKAIAKRKGAKPAKASKNGKTQPKAKARKPAKASANGTITKRNLKPGTKLVAKYKGKQYTATVVEDGPGFIGFKTGGKVYASASAAAGAIVDGPNQPNGWLFWSIG